MNPKRLVIAIVVVFLGVFFTDCLIHGVWLKQDYCDPASAGLWRSEADMQKHMGWLMLGQLIATVSATMLYAKGFAEKACVRCAVLFGVFMSLFMQANTLITYAVQPLPATLAVKWFVSGVAQGAFVGLILFYAYKPKPAAGS